MQFPTNLNKRGVNILYDHDDWAENSCSFRQILSTGVWTSCMTFTALIIMLDNTSTLQEPFTKTVVWFQWTGCGQRASESNPYTSQETFYTSHVKIKMIIMNDLPKQVIGTSPSIIWRGKKSNFSRIFLMNVRSCWPLSTDNQREIILNQSQLRSLYGKDVHNIKEMPSDSLMVKKISFLKRRRMLCLKWGNKLWPTNQTVTRSLLLSHPSHNTTPTNKMYDCPLRNLQLIVDLL